MEPSIPDLLADPLAARDVAWLRRALQWAVQLELTTIPPYLCAMWSITSGPVRDELSAIVLEEMFHMALACNMMTTLGATPVIASPDAAPKYPGPLPGNVHPGLSVGLERMSMDLVTKTLLEIERPNFAPLAEDVVETFATIGAFYEAIESAFDALPDGAITGARQVHKGSRLFAITSKADAKRAIARIRSQGEGSTVSPDFDGEHAHFYRLGEIVHERRLQKVGDGWDFLGALLPFPGPNEILPMATVPVGGFPESRAFDAVYSDLLRSLERVWRDGGSLSEAIGAMDELGAPAQELMKGGLGPSFLFV